MPMAQPDEDRGGEQDREVSAAITELAEDDVEPARRRKLLGRLVRDQARVGGVRSLLRPKAVVRWMTGAVTALAPRVPVRDLATLRRHFPDLDGEDLADRLVRNAARVTAGIGAAGGGV